MEQVLLDTMYDLPSMEDVSKVVIDESVVLGENDPYIVYESSEKQLANSSDSTHRSTGR